MESSHERNVTFRQVVDPYEAILDEGKIPRDLQTLVKNLRIRGESSPRHAQPPCSVEADVCFAQNPASFPDIVVSSLPDEPLIPTPVKEANAGKVGFGAEAARDGARIYTGDEVNAGARDTMSLVAEEALRFAADVVKRFGFLELKLSISSSDLKSDQGSSSVPPRITASCATDHEDVVHVAHDAAEIKLCESKDEFSFSLVRKSPVSNDLELLTPKSEALADSEAEDRILSRKRKAVAETVGLSEAHVKRPSVCIEEPMQHNDLGFLTQKEDPVGKLETANDILVEKHHLENLESGEHPPIAVKKDPGFSDAKGNSSGKYAAAVDNRVPLSDTSMKGDCSYGRTRVPEIAARVSDTSGKTGVATPVNVTSDPRDRRSLADKLSASKAPICRSRTRGARISDEIDEDPGTKDADRNDDGGENLDDGGENLGVAESGKKSRPEVEKSHPQKDLDMSKSKGGPSGQKTTEHAPGLKNPSSSVVMGNSGQASTPAFAPLTFLQAVKILSKESDRRIEDEFILDVARRAGYSFP